MGQPEQKDSTAILFRKIDQQRAELTEVKIEQARQDERLKTMQELATNTLVQMTSINAKLDGIQTDIHAKIDKINVEVEQVRGASKLISWMGPKGIAAALAIVGTGAAVGTKVLGG